jgi:hypothetical protein
MATGTFESIFTNPSDGSISSEVLDPNGIHPPTRLSKRMTLSWSAPIGNFTVPSLMCFTMIARSRLRFMLSQLGPPLN